MAMEVKRDQALSPEARQYLADRNQQDLIDQIDERYPPPKDSAALVSPNDGWTPASGLENLSDEDLLAEIERRRQSGARGDSGDSGDDEELHETPYEQWTAAELDEELAGRTDETGKPLLRSGTKAEKAARLRLNDEYLDTLRAV